MKYLALYIILLFIFLSGCTEVEDVVSASREMDNGTVNATFIVELPGQSSPSTRSVSVADENYLETVDVLVFKQNTDGNEYLAYKVEAKGVNNSNETSKKFTISLQRSEQRHRFVFIANARIQVNTLNLTDTTQTKDQITQQLSFENTGKWNSTSSSDFTPLPMWGESGLYTITNFINNISGIKLLRMIARVDIQISGGANFLLEEVYVYNRNTVGRIVPDATALDVSSMRVTQPSLPNSPNTSPTWLLYTTTNGNFVRDIYLFETLTKENRNEATCLVIGGRYNGENKTYYRADFFDNSNQSYSDILRNHLYSITITDVSGNGYLTPDHAFASESQNMTTDIFVWDQGGLNNIIFNSEYLLGVNINEFNLSSSAYTTSDVDNAVVIGTNYPNGWQLESIEDEVGTPIPDWLKLSQSNSLSAAKTNVYLLLSTNTDPCPRTGHIRIRAGSLIHEVVVTQNGHTVETDQLLDAEGNAYTIAKFGSAGWWMTQNLRVKKFTNGETIPNNPNPSEVDTYAAYVYPNNNSLLVETNPEYGLLYNWYAASKNQYSEDISTTETPINGSNVQGACPDGWVLPNDKDWNDLEAEIANNPCLYSTNSGTNWDDSWRTITGDVSTYRGTHGASMKSANIVLGSNILTRGLSKPSVDGGFDALPMGNLYFNTGFTYYGDYSYFWSSGQVGGGNALLRSTRASQDGVRRIQFSKKYFFSVRCKKAG